MNQAVEGVRLLDEVLRFLCFHVIYSREFFCSLMDQKEIKMRTGQYDLKMLQ